jgi:hypothetical protein
LPDFFCGNADQRWQDWLSDFELFNSLNHWSDAEKVNFIGIRLKGAPRDVYRSLMEQEKSSYDRLKTALTERFEPLDRTEVFRTEFRWRVKREGERLLDFGMAIRSLASRAFPQMTLSQRNVLARDQFIEGIFVSDTLS